MIDILLITDIPRVRKIFSRLADARTIKVRVANSLEKGAEELLAEKPTMVFVQTHLSGLSAEIILKHLKNQLGRKRTRFILLATTDQVSHETINSYHGHIDISEPDDTVQNRARTIMAELLAKPVKKAPLNALETISEPVQPPDQNQNAATLENTSIGGEATVTPLTLTDLAIRPATETLSEPLQPEPSAAEQGIAYPARPRLSVYSEFNSSFDSAVNTMEQPEKVTETLRQQEDSWQRFDSGKADPVKLESKRNFLFWLAPVIIVVILVTLLQQKRTVPEKPKTAGVAIQPELPKTVEPAAELAMKAPKPPAAPLNIAPAPLKQQAAVATTASVASPPPAQKPVPPAAVPVASAPQPKQELAAPSKRLKQLPDFVPRYGHDKNYGKENPGWERYKGQVTEFKILREGEGIKAIQVVDRGGKGVPESFMKGVARQLAKKPSFEITSTEKKDGYEIQRGKLSELQDVVYYRDADGGRLRGFVVTWR